MAYGASIRLFEENKTESDKQEDQTRRMDQYGRAAEYTENIREERNSAVDQPRRTVVGES